MDGGVDPFFTPHPQVLTSPPEAALTQYEEGSRQGMAVQPQQHECILGGSLSVGLLAKVPGQEVGLLAALGGAVEALHEAEKGGGHDGV